MKRSLIAAAALSVALTGVGAATVAVNADSVSPPTGVQAHDTAKAKTLTISMYAFTPSTLKVKAGQKITVNNLDGVEHTVTSVDKSSFNLRVPPDSTGTFTAPSTPGKYPYFCRIHRSMKGVLVVR